MSGNSAKCPGAEAIACIQCDKLMLKGTRKKEVVVVCFVVIVVIVPL